MQKISQKYLANALSIRIEYNSLLKSLESLINQRESIISFINEKVKDLYNIKENIGENSNKDRVLKNIEDKLSEVENTTKDLESKMKKISDTVDELSNKEKSLYDDITNNYPKLTDQDIITQIKEYLSNNGIT